MTTIAALITAVSGMTVSGVITNQAYRPESEQTADLPVLFPDPPTASSVDELYGSTCSTSKEVRVWIIIEADGQSTPAAKYTASVAMQDSLIAALETLKETLRANGSFLIQYETGSGSTSIGGIAYYAVYADIIAVD